MFNLLKLLERENKETLISLVITLCEKNKQNKETIISLLNKR